MSNKLPVVGSTAATTAFCMARVDGPDGTFLYIDGNGKITAGNGTLNEPKPNAFSLPAAGVSGLEHCPQSTPTCRQACYVENLASAQAATYALYQHNATEIRRILADKALADRWAMVMADWISAHAPHGFRWHVSGDVFSLDYAQWIADVCAESPRVEHWIYTRSFDHLEPLAEVSTLIGGNLAINLSCDVDNYEEAREASFWFGVGLKRLRLCYLTVDGTVPENLNPDDDVIFPDYRLRPRQFATLAESEWWQGLKPVQRGMVCPTDAHGKSEKVRCGPCSRCIR